MECKTIVEGESGNARNFRSSYYEKLGFCGNEEKNILDLLLASCPFDLEKLSEFYERFDLDRRCVETWKILLGVECDRKNPFDEYANVRRVRTEHFQSLKHNLEVLLKHNVVLRNRLKKCSNNGTKSLDNHKHLQENCNDEQNEHLSAFDGQENIATLLPNNNTPNNNSGITSENVAITPPPPPTVNQTLKNFQLEDIETNPGRQITLMYLLEAGQLDSSDIDAQLESSDCKKMSAMAMFFVNVSSDLQEAFFLFRNFTRKLEKNEALVKRQVNKACSR